MKTINILFAIIVVSIAQVANAQDSKRNLRNFEPKSRVATMKVHGECGMCERCIESALGINGIKSASWNVDTKILTVQYFLTADISGVDKIQKLAADAGHDTESYNAKDSLYTAFPGCCKYQRPENVRSMK